MLHKEYGYNIKQGAEHPQTPNWMKQFGYSDSPVKWNYEIIIPEIFWNKMKKMAGKYA